MQSLRSLLVIVILATNAGWAVSDLGGAEGKADRDALRKLQRQLHNPTPSQRVEAVEGLCQLATPEAAKLLVPFALTDPEDEVRRAAYNALLAWKDNRDLGDFLVKALGREIRGKKSNVPLAVMLLAALLASDQPETQHDLSILLDGKAGARVDGVLLMTTVADELGKLGDRQSLTSLQRMTKLKCFSQTFACRRAIIQAMILIRLPEAVDDLIALLPDVGGEARGDILKYLGELSNEQYGASSEAWQTWWKGHKDGFEFPAKKSAEQSAGVAMPETPSYYGLPIQARRMVFVVDISGSMHGPRLQAAERELTKTLDDLPEDASFTIVAFSSQVMVWKTSLMRATPAVKRSAEQYVYGLRAGGQTAAYDALDTAFHFDAEAVYFLSDGAPNCGKIVDPAAIVEAVTQANRSRRITLNSIGFFPGVPGGPLDLFMKTLAEQNFGSYRRIDQ